MNNVVCNWETIGYNMGGDSAGESGSTSSTIISCAVRPAAARAIGGGNTDFHIYHATTGDDGEERHAERQRSVAFVRFARSQFRPTLIPSRPARPIPCSRRLKLAISDAGPSFRRDTVDELMISELTSWGLDGGTITSNSSPDEWPGPRPQRHALPRRRQRRHARLLGKRHGLKSRRGEQQRRQPQRRWLHASGRLFELARRAARHRFCKTRTSWLTSPVHPRLGCRESLAVLVGRQSHQRHGDADE